MREHHGGSITKTARTVLRNGTGYAVRQDAIAVNPMREVSRMDGGTPKPHRFAWSRHGRDGAPVNGQCVDELKAPTASNLNVVWP